MRRLLVLVALAFALPAKGVTIERVTDGSFEDASPAWAFDSAFRCSDAVCGLPAADGSFYGSNAYNFELAPAMVFSWSLGSFQQSVALPESPATLEFSVRRVDSGVAVSTYLWVTLDGALLRQIDTELAIFERVSIAIPESFVGIGSRVLRFEVICQNEAPQPVECDRFDVDDVSLVTPEPGAVALGLVATALLAALGWRRSR
jgi:hypothetical protein